MRTKGIKHAQWLINAGMFGMGIGGIIDYIFGLFPLFFGVLMLASELTVYFYLKVKLGENITE